MILLSTEGQTGLPRYFARVFALAQGVAQGQLDMELPDGRVFRATGARPGYTAKIKIHSQDVFARLVREGDLGFCDSYIEGGWSSPDLQAFLDFLHTDNEMLYRGFPGQALVRAYERLRFWMQSNSKRQAQKNISYHYDLGNDFYALWLDPSMTYSSAYFKSGEEALEKAQEQKYASLVDQMGVQPGDHVLEIGCGWGGFAEYARVCESSGELKPANVTFEEAAVVPQAGVLVISILAPRSQRNCRSAINHSFRHLVENPHRLSSLAIDDAVDRVFLQALQAE